MKDFIRLNGVGLMLSVSAFGLAAPAAAQEAAAQQDGGVLEDIVVTAQKRGENLQKTPIAISAVTAKDLDLKQLTEIKDLSAIAPNVSVLGGTTSNAASVVSIRGIPSPADETQGYDSPVGIYVDGVYLARSSASSFEVADIERVEVLRGPQGTLFGRNTTGGAVNFITKLPDDEASLRVRLGAGNYGQRVGRAILNSGDIGGLRMSLGYLHRQRNGVIDNKLQPKDSLDPGGYKVDGVRWAATLDLTDNLKVTNILDWSKIYGVPPATTLIAVADGTVRQPVTIDGHVFQPIQPQNIAGYLAASRSLSADCPITVTRAYQSKMCLDRAGPSTDKLWGNMTRVELDLGGATLRSTTAFRRWKNHLAGSDLDGVGPISGPSVGALNATNTLNGFPVATLTALGIPAAQAAYLSSQPVPAMSWPLFVAQNDRKQRQFSQEFELVSDSGGPFQWVLGAFYFKERGSETNPQFLTQLVDTNQLVYTAANLGPLAPAAPLLQATNPMRFRMYPVATVLSYDAWASSKAVYGQGTYRFGEEEKLGVTLGLRYSWDKKRFAIYQNGLVPFTAAERALANREKKFSALSGNLTIDYRATPDMNFYARVAKGYRSGGFNARQTVQVANPSRGIPEIALTPFNEETLWSYEAGAKMKFGSRARLNLAAFFNEYNDQIVTVPLTGAGTSSFGTTVLNAGKTQYMGVEAEGLVAFNDIFSVDASIGYIDIKTKQYPYRDVTGTLQNIGSVIPASYAPKWTANLGLNASFPMGDTAKATARVGYNYTSSFIMYSNPLARAFDSSVTKGDARGLVDAQLRFDGLNFGGLDTDGTAITFWAKNLTNKKYTTRTVDFSSLGMANANWGDPRTFGVTLDTKF